MACRHAAAPGGHPQTGLLDAHGRGRDAERNGVRHERQRLDAAARASQAVGARRACRCAGRAGPRQAAAAAAGGCAPRSDRLEAPVGRVGAGVDLEAEAEVGQVREEELRGSTASAARGRSSPTCRGVGTIATHRPQERPRPGAGRPSCLPRSRAGLGLESGTDRLERVDEAVGRDHPQRIERAGRACSRRPRAPRPGRSGCPARGRCCSPARPARARARAGHAAARWRRRAASRRRPPGSRGVPTPRPSAGRPRAPARSRVTTASAPAPSSGAARPARARLRRVRDAARVAVYDHEQRFRAC